MKYYELGKLLKYKREDAGLTQKQLAEKLDIHIQQVSNFERGLCKIPADKFRRACTILKIGRVEARYTVGVDDNHNLDIAFNKMWNP